MRLEAITLSQLALLDPENHLTDLAHDKILSILSNAFGARDRPPSPLLVYTPQQGGADHE